MTIAKKLKLGFLIAAFVAAMMPAQLVLAGDEQRAPPEARTSGTLGAQVLRAITQIQEMMQPEDEDDEPDLAGAKAELDELYERRFERMNDFEKSTVLSFYTNYYLTTEDYPGAIGIYEQMLDIETLREDTRLRTYRSLGQLYAAEEEWQKSIDNLEAWRDLSIEEDTIVFRNLAYGHYQMDSIVNALPHWLDFMNLSLDLGMELGRDDYGFLNGLYFGLEDYESARDLTKTMIVKFDDRRDWQNLSAIYAGLDNEDRRVQSLNLYYLKGFMEDEVRFLNLGQSLAGIDAPYTGAKIIQEGLDGEAVEADVDNLTTVTQMHLMASEYASALVPALVAADLDETGDGWDTVGYIHYVMTNYEESVTAFDAAIEKGDLTNEADTLLFLSRAHLELRNFDEAEAAARQSSEAGDERATTAAQNFIRAIDGRRTFHNTIAGRKADAIDFYESYPPLR